MPNKELKNANLQKANAESHKIVEESLKVALFDLLRTKDIRDITVTELVKKAGVSRAVFYKHYYLVTDVLKKTVKDASYFLRDSLTGSLYDRWLHILNYTYEKREELLLIIKADMALDIIRSFNNLMREEQEEERYLAWNGIIFNEILYWAKQGFKKSPESLAKTLTELTLPLFKDI